jgi:predicted transcriptional regulator
MDEMILLRLLANGPKYLAEIEHTASCSHMSALSAAVRLRKQRLIKFSYLKNSPLYITAGGKDFLRRMT